MQKLTNKEEEIMHILWKLEKAFVKDVLAQIKDDKPHKERFMNAAIENYFNNSYKNVVSFFAKEEKISVEELKEIIALIEKQG